MTMQIGSRLVRNFGENGIKVVTESLNGKTYTKVFNRCNNIIKERVTQNEAKQIGDNFVRTRTKIEKAMDDECEDIVYGISKTVEDRVYQGDQFLGRRLQRYRKVSDDLVLDNKVLENNLNVLSKLLLIISFTESYSFDTASC